MKRRDAEREWLRFERRMNLNDRLRRLPRWPCWGVVEDDMPASISIAARHDRHLIWVKLGVEEDPTIRDVWNVWVADDVVAEGDFTLYWQLLWPAPSWEAVSEQIDETIMAAML